MTEIEIYCNIDTFENKGHELSAKRRTIHESGLCNVAIETKSVCAAVVCLHLEIAIFWRMC